MRTSIGQALLAALVGALAARGGEAPPNLVLYLPFDGSADAAFAANGQLKTACVRATYPPGKHGQAAQIGSARVPCGLVARTPGTLSKERGTIEFWYSPSWDSVDPAEQAERRTLLTDELDGAAAGHFWLSIEGRAVHFGWRLPEAAGVTAPIRDWRKGSWHHIAATWDQDRGVALYLDGELAADRALRWRLPPSGLLYVGANRHGADRAGGLLDELRLYDRALTATEVELAGIRRLEAPNAPVRPLPSPPEPLGGLKEPTPIFHATFDDTLEAKAAAGAAKPALARGAEFTAGLVGSALAARPGLQLAYSSEKNLSNEAGAISFWARSLPNPTQPRGILLTQGVEAGTPASEAPGLLALGVERGRVPQLYVSLGLVTLQASLPYWNEGEWYHIAASWLRGRQVVLYVNGRPVARRVGRAATWLPGPAKLLHVGSVEGRLAAEALLDDLRVYDGPLTADQVRKEASQFLLPWAAQVSPTLVERGRSAELAIRFYNLIPGRVAAKLQIRVLNPANLPAASTEADLDIAPHGAAEARLALTGSDLALEGVYRIVTASPGRVATPSAYFLVVPAVERQAATEGHDAPRPILKLVETLDCATLDDPLRFCHSGRATVADSPKGRYREAGPATNDRFACRFSVARAGQPHLLLVTYPNDRARSAEITVSSPLFPSSLDVATGYFRPGDPPPGPMIDLPLYLWPREKDNAIFFRTLEPNRPAAAAQIAVHQISGGLPSARVEPPPDGGRAVGLYWQDPAVPLQFGAQRFAPPDLFQVFDRLTEYLRFTGQNLIAYPVAWRKGLLYGSVREGFQAGSGAERHCNDWIEYVLYLCERRALRFLPELFLEDTFALADAYGSQTEEDLAAGHESARLVLWDGTLSRGGSLEPPLYDPLHPAVRAALLDRMDEIAARYGRSPALEGVSLTLGPSQFAWYASLQSGYGDHTIALFERETDLRVPADRSGSARFAQRARWLLENKRDEWISWRCRKLAELYAEAARRLQAARPDLKLFLTLATPDGVSLCPLLNLGAWSEAGRSLGTLYREGGVDLALLAKSPGVVVRRVLFPTDERHLAYRVGGGSSPQASLISDFEHLSEAYAPLRGSSLPAVAGSYRFFESAAGLSDPMPGCWWAENPWRASQPTPSGRLFLEPHALALAELDVFEIAVGGLTTVTMGHEEHVLEFARAFRALPRRPFEDVPGMADPVCARQLADGESHYLYLVSRAPYPTEAFIVFEEKGVGVRDFAAGKDLALPYVEARPLPAAMPKGFVSEHRLPREPGPLPGQAETQPATGSLLHVPLEPYQLRSYRLPAKAAKIAHASASVPQAERLRLAQAIETARSVLAGSGAAPALLDEARATLRLIERAWLRREYVRVADLLRSHPLERLR